MVCMALPIILIALLLAAPLTATEAVCIQYDPHVVSLSGTVIYRTFADAMGRPERVPLLLLDDPICVEGLEQSEDSPAEADQIVVGLNFDPDRYGGEQAWSSQRVVATGSLYHRHTMHHHAALVLM